MICNTMQGCSRGDDRADEGHHRGPLERARSMPANLLLNTGPLPDGSIHFHKHFKPAVSP